MITRISFSRQGRQILLTTLSLLCMGPTLADEEYDLEKVAICVACHGADGIGKSDQYPDLQGKPVEYIAAQLGYFKSGLRESSTMNRIAAPLSDKDIKMLSEFYSRVE